ncbi:MAG: response regulator [Pyrinomonadaceae bacterium]
MTTSIPQLNNRTNAPVVHSHATSVKPLVLVVEDHDDTVFLLKYLLEMRGYRVMVAGDGEMAVCLAEERCPDLILMDTSLPRLDGLAATRRIRALAALHDVPIVFLSGHTEASFRARALETGGNDYLTKPFEISQLERLLERHLGSAAAGKAE